MSWHLQDTKHGVSFRESSPKMIDKMFSSTAPLEFHLILNYIFHINLFLGHEMW